MAKTVFEVLREKQTPEINKEPMTQKKQDENWHSFFSKLTAKTEIPDLKEENEEELLKGLPQEETTGEFLTRTAARTPVKGAEGIINMFKGLSELPGHVLKGPVGQQIVQALKPISGISQYLPEQEEMEKFERKHTGEYLQPHTPKEATWDEYVKDLSSMLALPEGKIGMLSNLGRSAAIAGAGIGAKELAKETGLGKEEQGYSKIGANLLAGMINPKGLMKMSSDLRKTAKSSIPKDAMGDATKLEADFTNKLKEIRYKQPTPAGKKIEKEISDILPFIKNNKLSYDQAVEIKTALNQNAENLYKEPELGTSALRDTRRGYNDIRKSLKDFIDQSEKEYPEFYKNIKKSDEVYGAIAGSNIIKKYISDNRKAFGAAGILTPVIELFTIGAAGIIPTVAGIGAVAASHELGKLGYRMMKSPTIREHYLKALTAASKRNSGIMIQEMKRMQNEMEKDPDISKILREESQ